MIFVLYVCAYGEYDDRNLRQISNNYMEGEHYYL